MRMLTAAGAAPWPPPRLARLLDTLRHISGHSAGAHAMLMNASILRRPQRRRGHRPATFALIRREPPRDAKLRAKHFLHFYWGRSRPTSARTPQPLPPRSEPERLRGHLCRTQPFRRRPCRRRSSRYPGRPPFKPRPSRSSSRGATLRRRQDRHGKQPPSRCRAWTSSPAPSLRRRRPYRHHPHPRAGHADSGSLPNHRPHTALRVANVVGGVKIEPQIGDRLARSVDVLIATPGPSSTS